MIAEIADNLQETLLLGGGFQQARRSTAEESLSRELQDGIIFAGGPEEITRLSGFSQGLILAGQRTNVEPGKDDVDRQVGDALFAQERLCFPERF